MVEAAKRPGKVVVYSSKPIADGVFVTPSKMEAQNYAGEGKVYSKEVAVDDVAWIDAFQGQYAKVEGTEESKGATVSFSIVEPVAEFDESKLDTQDVFAYADAINERNATKRAKEVVAPMVEEIGKEYKGVSNVILSTGREFLEELAKDNRLTEKERNQILQVASGKISALAGYIPSIDKIIIFNLDVSKSEIKSYLCHEAAHRAIQILGLENKLAGWYGALKKRDDAAKIFDEVRREYVGFSEAAIQDESIVHYIQSLVDKHGIEGAAEQLQAIGTELEGITEILNYIENGNTENRPIRETNGRSTEDSQRDGHDNVHPGRRGRDSVRGTSEEGGIGFALSGVARRNSQYRNDSEDVLSYGAKSIAVKHGLKGTAMHQYIHILTRRRRGYWI